MDEEEEQKEYARVERARKRLDRFMWLWWLWGLGTLVRDWLARFRRWRIGGRAEVDRITVFHQDGTSVFRQNIQDECLLPYYRHTHFYVIESENFIAHFDEEGLHVSRRAA